MRWRTRAKNPEPHAEYVGAVPSLTADLDAWSAYIPVGPSRDGRARHTSQILLPRTGSAEDAEVTGRHPFGFTDEVTMRGLLAAVERVLDIDDDVVCAFWAGYAGDRCAGTPVRMPSETVGPWNVGQDLLLRLRPLRSLMDVAEADEHWPVLVWNRDVSFVLSCPLYSDSVLLSSSEISSRVLEREGLHAVEIDLTGPLTFTGD